MARTSSPARISGPSLHAFVRGDQASALLVAVRGNPEEQRGIGTAHRLEADLIEDQQAGVDVLLAPQQRGREICVAAHQRQQLIEAVERVVRAADNWCRALLLDSLEVERIRRAVLSPSAPDLAAVSAQAPFVRAVCTRSAPANRVAFYRNGRDRNPRVVLRDADLCDAVRTVGSHCDLKRGWQLPHVHTRRQVSTASFRPDFEVSVPFTHERRRSLCVGRYGNEHNSEHGRAQKEVEATHWLASAW